MSRFTIALDKTRNAYKFFSESLLGWDEHIDRGMPWQGEKDPYKIWLSEILLQQTRVQQGLSYYLNFVEAYPTVQDLAKAEDDEVFRLWQGLGYYSRCRNLLHTARFITNELDGVFPHSYDELLKLKGIGTYTAAAISSFAFGDLRPVIDGNVLRVISRFFGIEDPIDTKSGRNAISKLTKSCIEITDNSAAYNQAIMNFGAIQCTPKFPKCSNCPLVNYCKAYQLNLVSQIPIKSKKIKKRERYFVYFNIESNEHILIKKRTDRDIWQNLYELPMTELSTPFRNLESISENWAIPIRKELIESLNISTTFKQNLTHQKIIATYVDISLIESNELATKPYFWVSKSELDQYAFPKIILDFLKVRARQLGISY
ncbi:MAG: A/G-specific adenine glycosylase [Bacteroidia bacterium]|nr:A/G-specific adenine glycosylase [Bacteroidia bacterium]